MPLWEMQEILARQPGTHVPLELIRVGETVQATFDLKPFDPPPVAWRRSKGAMLRIPSFGRDTAEEVRKALAENRARAGQAAGRPPRRRLGGARGGLRRGGALHHRRPRRAHRRASTIQSFTGKAGRSTRAGP